MSKVIPLIFVFISFNKLSAQEILSPSEISHKLTFFYQNPDSLALKSIVYSMSESEDVQKNFPPTAAIGFCTSILLKRDANSTMLAKELKKYAPGNQLFGYILSLGKTRDTLVNWGSHSADVNDLMWSAFFGTGNNKYLDRLISELSYLEREDSLDLILAAHSAKWSLASNARQHKKIGEYLWSKANNAEGDTKKILFEILMKEPDVIRDEFVARIKEMKNKGLLPAQDSNNEEPELNFTKKDKLSEISFSWNNHRIRFEVEAKSIKQLDAKGFFDADGQVVQFSTVKIPSNVDLMNLNDEKEISILRGYVQYEFQYFQNELKLEVKDLKIDTKTLNGKNFIEWEFRVTTKPNQQINKTNKQIYYTAVFWDRVVSINSPVMLNDDDKRIEKKLELIAKSLKVQ